MPPFQVDRRGPREGMASFWGLAAVYELVRLGGPRGERCGCCCYEMY
jgi:hypothetical protein